jgi:Flp pilus assembly protein TadD
LQPEIERMYSAGFAALQGGDFAGAGRWFGRVIALQPANHAAWNGLAWACLRSGQSDHALEHALRAHAMSRRNVDYLNTLGAAYGETGQLELAESVFRKALKLKPAHPDTLVNLAKALEKREQLPEALRIYERALAIAPQFPKLAANLALLYRQTGNSTRARSLLEAAKNTMDAQDFTMGMAECDVEAGDLARALDRLGQAVADHPDWMLARNSLAHQLLSAGQWREGWRQYLWRNFAASPNAGQALPLRLDGQRILLQREQGIGDVLFFLRFVPALRARGALVGLDCEAKLHPLLSGSGLLGASAGFDRKFAIGDLPALLESDDTPAAWPLVVSDEEKRAARERLAALGRGPTLAVTWRAGTDTARAREFGEERISLTKSLPPQALGAALRGWPGTVVLLQRGARAGEAAEFAAALQAPAHDLSALGEDLRALLAVLAVVDDYVTVSNTNVHLLAGLNRTARVLVPRPQEWRWMHAGDASPWFPGFKIYRQPPSRGWEQPLLNLRKDLFS